MEILDEKYLETLTDGNKYKMSGNLKQKQWRGKIYRREQG
jgi:hypothetical protein